jgi:methylaspartate mutase sigma subunit
MRTEAHLAARMADRHPELVPAFPVGERPVVILGVAASDPHVVANHLIAMHLRDSGFDVINLGACTPVEEFVEAWQRHPGALAILIGSLNGHAAEDLAGLGDLKRDYQVRCPVIVGGNLSVGANKTGDEAARLLADGVDAVLTDADQIVPRLDALLAARDAAVIHA